MHVLVLSRVTTAMNVSADDLPPKRPNSPYVIFFVKHTKDAFRNGLQKEGGVIALAKRAGEAWTAMSTAEKQVITRMQATTLGCSLYLITQPYYDESEVLKEQYLKAREQYFTNVDPKVLSAINKKRKERGLSRIRDPNKEPQLPTPYLRLVEWTRANHYAQFDPPDLSVLSVPVLREMRL